MLCIIVYVTNLKKKKNFFFKPIMVKCLNIGKNIFISVDLYSKV